MGEKIDQETYLELKADFEAKINELKQKLPKHEIELSNQEKYFQISEEIVQNISKYWLSEDIDF